MKRGELFTIAGLYKKVPNPARKWWTPWRPRLVASAELQTFEVQAVPSEGGFWDRRSHVVARPPEITPYPGSKGS